ncbi:H(+)/Cl(-) exchange transporter 7-like isoform X2 [Biomphalaria glabrata]|uniref:Chloride channel protein n=1 Tax=Biomphalaria glabrata TaxID=6526 RepID=A0A9W2ZNK1_BIOGL|nr:H(+)/Cl(-) exchange transporter 7-like isoform X2 [Biomphalaria glabrata]KAI8797392.1 H(+)/Cl(-) exchange transporter 7 [Biomphalaria glabrata]
MDERTPLLNNHPQFSISTINHRRTRGENDFQTPVRPVSGKVNTAPQDDNNAEVINSETFNNIRRDVEGHHAVQPKNVHIEQGHILKVGFQSLDYEISDNQIYQNEEKEKSFKRWKLYWRGVKRWIICFLIGVFTGLTAGFIDFGVEKISEVKFQTVKIWVDKCVLDNCMYLPQILWFLINMGLVLVGSFLTTYFEPVSAGSGIPQIKCYLNGVIVPHVVRFKTLVIKVIGVLSAVAGGLAVGKEGPMIHSGAVIAAGISQGRTTSLGWDFKIFQEFRSDTEKRDFVSAGAAAGVAAAFGAPVGGVLFSLEEGASFWNQSLVWRIFFASIISTMTLNIVQGLIKGHPMDFSYPGLINFGTFDDVRYEFYELFIVICLGAIGGLLGALFNHINLKLTVFRMKYVQRKWQKVLETMMVAMYTAAFAYIIIFYKNDCKPIENDAETTLVQFFCQDGQYSSTARLFFDTPEATVKHLFHNVPGTYQVVTLTIFASGYFLLACWTYGLSIPSGLFIPSLLIGAAWGRIAGILLSGLPGLEKVNLSFYSLVGASSMLGGIVRMTISLTVIIMEATSNVPLGFPVMLSLIVAKWVGDQFNEGIYDLHIHLQGVPILGWEPLPLSSNLSAKTVMSHPVIVFRMKEPVERIVKILKEEEHNGFPVVEDYDPDHPEMVDGCQTFGTFKGLILRSHLITMLKKKLFLENPEINKIVNNLKMSEFNESYPRYTGIQRISISPEEKHYTMDLAPFINQSHFVVLETASYSSIFRKFRSLGLRHMVVINFRNQVIGIVTRKDLARFMTECKNGEISIQEIPIIH